MITEVSIWDDPAGVRVSDQQMIDWILSHWLDCVGDGGIGMDIWDNLLVAYDDYLSNSGTPNPDTLQLQEIEAFTTALAGVDLGFSRPAPEVLLLRNKAVNYSNSSPWPIRPIKFSARTRTSCVSDGVGSITTVA